jgi:hypothetical protein
MRHTTIGGVGVAVALLLAGCGPLIPTPVRPVGSPLSAKGPLMAEFDRNLGIWQAAGITTYAFTYEPDCFCDNRPRLVVADGDEIRIDGVAAGQRASAPAGVPGLFELVRRAINGDRVSVEYDDVTGVPRTMDSDPVANGIDDELRFTVRDWTLDPPDDRVLGEISGARAVWQGRSIDTYEMTVKVNHEVFVVKVKDGDPSVTQGGRTLRPDDIIELPVTVPALFDLAASSAITGRTTVTFDAELGYPTSILIASDTAADIARDTIKVTNFRVP